MIAFVAISLLESEGETGGGVEVLRRRITVFLAGCTPGVEMGEDGWFVDLGGCERLLGYDFAGWGGQIGGLLRCRFGVVARVGIGSNKVTAELACRLGEVGNVVWLFPGSDRELMGGVSLDRVPGLTVRQRRVLEDRRLLWVREVRALGEDVLRVWLGNREGTGVWRVMCGVCDEPVRPWRMPRVIRKSYVFPEAVACLEEVVRAGVFLAGGLYHEVGRVGGVLRRISCRMVYVDGLEVSREVRVGDFYGEEECGAAMARMLENLPWRRVMVRGLYVECPVEFEAVEQQDLFSEQERLKRRDLERALADVREKYGVEALHRASGMRRGRGRLGLGRSSR